MAKVSVNSSQNKCCHLKCGNQACKGKERNVTCNPSGSVNKLGSCFRFLSDKTTYLTVSKVISSCWNSGKSREGSFAILQLLFKLLVESLFQFLELSHFICLAQEHAQSGSALRSRHRRVNNPDLTGEVPCVWKSNDLHSSQDVFVNSFWVTELHSSPKPTQQTPGENLKPSPQPCCADGASQSDLAQHVFYKEKGLDMTNTCQMFGDSVPAFSTKITCLWHICEHPFLEAK